MNVRKTLEIWHPQRNKSRSTIISVSVLYINTSLWQSWKDSQGLRTCGIRVFTQAGKLSNVYFQVIFDCENVWLPSGHSRAQPPLGLTQDMPCLTWKLSGTDRMAMSKARWDQKLISNSAGAWRGLLHFCWEQNIPTNAVCRKFVRENRNERRGRVSQNVEEMAECKEICDHIDQTNSVWVETTRTRDDKNCPSRIVLKNLLQPPSSIQTWI